MFELFLFLYVHWSNGRHGRHLSSRWRHQMETFSVLLAICAGNSPVPGEFPTQRPVTRSFDVSLICVWINCWVNNREAGDLRRYCAHCDVSVKSLGGCTGGCRYYNQDCTVDVSIVVIGGTEGCRYDNLRYPQWRQSWSRRRLVIKDFTLLDPDRHVGRRCLGVKLQH